MYQCFIYAAIGDGIVTTLLGSLEIGGYAETFSLAKWIARGESTGR